MHTICNLHMETTRGYPAFSVYVKMRYFLAFSCYLTKSLMTSVRHLVTDKHEDLL